MTTAFEACSWLERAVGEIYIEIFISLPLVNAMAYKDMPIIIPILATGYLLTIYLLLMLAQRTTKSSRYVANSVTDAYDSYMEADYLPQIDGGEPWSLRLTKAASLALANRAEAIGEVVASRELLPESRYATSLAHQAKTSEQGLANSSNPTTSNGSIS
jgi:hypothetical protein